MSRIISVLCARRDSVYKQIEGCDVWDADRDAWDFKGENPIVAHPPCRQWGRLRFQANGSPQEKALAVWCIMKIRENGGVLEHPAQSSLFKQMGLPRPGDDPDCFGGWTMSLSQFWFGHRAEKPTWLYVLGVRRSEAPELPLKLGKAPRVISAKNGLLSGMPGYRKEVTRSEREETPVDFAEWLVDLARRTQLKELASA